jgi:electron transport complex protein RnfG
MSLDRSELVRITGSMAVTCALGALILGAVFVATERYQRRAAERAEQRAITELLQLDSSAVVTEVRQYLTPDRRQVLYRAFGPEEGEARELVFSLDGALASNTTGAFDRAEEPRDLIALGRIFLARTEGYGAGFVVEGVARGYKNRIRFLVGLRSDFSIAGVRVVEHEEDPGLGAEIAGEGFHGQYIGRTAEQVAALTVSRDPMPEDWRSALAQLRRLTVPEWIERNRDLIEREGDEPVYAVTGATISSEALTSGLRVKIEHFRHRWALIEPHLGGVGLATSHVGGAP